MMQKLIWFYVLSVIVFETAAVSEEYSWSLQKCIDIAVENNLQIKKLKLDSLEARLSYRAAKSALYPSVSGGISYSFSPQFKLDTNFFITGTDTLRQTGDRIHQSARYSVNGRWTVFDGLGLQTDIKIKELGIQKTGSSIKSSQVDLVLAVTNAYLQILYSKEGLQNAVISRDASRVQKERAEVLLSTGSASQVDLARMEASLATDEYNVVVAKNNYLQKERDLKKLLQIPLDSVITLYFPDLKGTAALPEIPPVDTIYSAALKTMPTIENSQINAQLAALSIKKARSSYYPSVSISGGISTGNSNGSGSFTEQLADNTSLSIGADLSIPIYDNNKKRTSLENAKIEEKRAELSLKEAQVQLYEDVLSAYYDAEAAKSKFEAAKLQLDRARQSYEIAQEQFKLGMINPTELLVEKNAYLSALTELLQSEYSAVLSIQLIQVLMGKSISL